MLGVFIALLIAGWKHFISHQAAEAIFLSATHFLLWWFIITTIILAVIYLILTILIALGITVAGAEKGGVIGGILGFLGGSALNFLILIVFAVARGLLIFGISLVHNSLIMTDGTPEWNVGKLILGIVLFIIGLIMNKSSKSSSSSS